MNVEAANNSWSTAFKGAVPALVLAIGVLLLLRFLGLPAGVRAGAAVLVLIVSHNFFFERAAGFRRTGAQWVGTVAIALAGAVAVGYLAGE